MAAIHRAAARMLHRGRIAAALLAIVGLVGAAELSIAPAASADGPGSGSPWVASLGDSYISGEGGRWAGNTDLPDTSTIDALGPTAYYDNPTHTAELIPFCHRSQSAEIYIGGGVQGENLACSGAETSTQVSDANGHFKPGIDFYSGSAGEGQALMLQQFAADHDVKMVALSIGGNDYHFGPIGMQCVEDFLTSSALDPTYCSKDPSLRANFSATNFQLVTADIAHAIGNIEEAMQNAGYSSNQFKIVVQTPPAPIPPASQLRYPQAADFERQIIGGCGLYDADVNWANNVVLPVISTSIETAVQTEQQAGNSNIVLMNLNSAFNGHELCQQGVNLVEDAGVTTGYSPAAVDKVEWVNQIRTASTIVNTQYQLQEDLHPNYWGQLALRNCLRQAYNNGAVQGGVCTPGTGLDPQSEPNMTLSPPPPNGTAGSATELQALSVPASTTYAAVPGSNSILRIDPDGSQSTITGPFVSPSDVAVNSQGSVYVASPGNGAVYVIPRGTGTPQIVTTLAERPTGVAVDRNDNLYVTDPGTNSILVPSSLPDAGLSNLNLNDPTGIAVDPLGNVYVADTGNNRVIRLTDVKGVWVQTTVASGLNRPEGVAVDTSGDVFIADSGDNQILEVSNYGLGNESVIPTYGLNDPTSVTIDQSGTIVVTDTGNNRLVEITPDGSQLDLASGVAATGAAIALPTNSLYVADNEQDQVWNVQPDGSASNVQITHGNDFCTQVPPCFSFLPLSVTMDGEGDLYAAELGSYDNSFGDFIFELPPGGGQIPIGGTWGDIGAMAADADGDLYVVDGGNLWEVPAGGSKQFLASVDIGSDVTVDAAGDVFVSRTDGSLDELTPGGQLHKLPQGNVFAYGAIAAGPGGMLYAYDAGNQRLVQRAPDGTDTVVDSWASSDITHPTSDDVCDLAVDPQGDIYVDDCGTGQIFEEIPAGSGWRRIQVIDFGGQSFLPAMAAGPVPGALANTQPVVLKATVRSDPFDSSTTTPTGTVTFYDAGQEIGTAPVLGGVATFVTNTLGGSTHDITAAYSGDTTFASSTSGVVPVAIRPLVTSTAISSDVTTTAWGQPVNLTATVTTSPPGSNPATGTVTFMDGHVTLGTAALSGTSPDTATLTTSSLSGGPHQITADYGVQPNFTASQSSPLTVTITNQVTTVSVSPSNASPGFASPVTLTATVTPTASANAGSQGTVNPMSGSVTFYDGGTSIGTVPVASGNPTGAAHTTSSLALGSHTITATYSGDANFATATSGGTSVNVVPAATAISLDATPNPGQAVYVADTGNNEVVRVAPDGTQTVVVSGLNAPRGVAVDAAGDVYVADTGNNRVVEVPLGGSERTVVSGLKQPQAVAVDNSGDVYVADTGNNRVIEVTPDNTQEVIASGLSDPTGVAVDPLGDVFIADQGSNRVLRVTPGELPDSITEALGGQTLVSPSSVAVDSNGTLVVTTGLSNEAYAGVLTIDPSGGDHYMFGPGFNDAGVAVGADGKVYVADTGTPGYPYEPDGAVFQTTEPNGALGFFNDASELGSGFMTPSGVAVGPLPDAGVGYGQQVTLNASVYVTPSGRPLPPGSVKFMDGSNLLGTVRLSASVPNSATLTTSSLARGSHPITAVYVPGSPDYEPSTSATQAVDVSTVPTTTALSFTTPPTFAGNPITFTATVNADSSATPTGTVTFYDGGTPLTTVSLPAGSNQASYTTSAIPAGSHEITADYNGDGNFGASQSNTAAFTLTAVKPPGAPTAVVAAAADGTAGVTWSAPTTTGGSPIQSYTVTPSPACPACQGLTTTATGTTVTGLTDGTTYTFTVTATNQAGTGPASPPSNSVTPEPAQSAGQAVAWGDNSTGELGDGTTAESGVPVPVIAPAGTSITQVVMSNGPTNRFGLALTSTGSVLAWGDNSSGQLGDGTNTAHHTAEPVQLPPGVVATSIAAGDDFGMALTAGGQVYDWGSTLGNGTFDSSDTPVLVSIPSGVTITAISAEWFAGLALASDGQVYAWGGTSTGGLGNGVSGSTVSNSPVTVSLPSDTTVTAISAGPEYALALTSDGNVLAWGANDGGQLGNSTLDGPSWGTGTNCDSATKTSATPVSVDALGGTTVTAISAGYQFAMALTSTGSVLGWGVNSELDLGTGNNTDCYPSAQPVDLPAGTQVSQISAGFDMGMALTHDGAVLAWGSNFSGELGDPQILFDSATPVTVAMPGDATASFVSAGNENSAAVLSGVATFPPVVTSVVPNTAGPGERVTVNGNYLDGGSVDFGGVVASADCTYGSCQATVPPGAGIVDVSVSTTFGTTPTGVADKFVYPATGQVLDWGDNMEEQLGAVTPLVNFEPSSNVPIAALLPPTTSVAQLATGLGDSAVLTTSGQVYVWGDNSDGEFGNGTIGNASGDGSPTPVLVPFPPNTTITQISVGFGHLLALTSGGQIYAWGRNSSGELGDGSTTDSPTPELIQLPTTAKVRQIAAGFFDSFALTSDGTVWAWGDNSDGALGTDSTASESTTPAAVDLPSGTIVNSISAGNSTALALASDGTVYSWGDNGEGQLGDGSAVTSSSVPVQVSIPSGDAVETVSSGAVDAALTSTGGVLTWGSNFDGELGTGSTATTSNVPVAVTLPGGAPAVEVSSNELNVMALTGDGTVYTWGSNDFGQLGIGSGAGDSTVPVAVPLPAGATAAYVLAGDSAEAVVTGVPANGIGITSVSPESGTPGTQVTISGRGLSGGSVSFGTTPATTASCSATHCTATAPPGSGTVDITVTTSAGTTAVTPADRFTYAGQPAFLQVTPGSTTTVVGVPQSFAVEAFDSGGIDLGADSAATLSIAPDGTCTGTTCTAASAGPHTVTATDSTVTPSATGAVTVTASRTGTQTVTTVSTGGNSVTGQPVVFTATVTAAAGGPAGVSPTGTVSFTESGAALPGCSAVALTAAATASCTDSNLFPGDHSVAASYSGDAVYESSAASAAGDTVTTASTTTSVSLSDTSPVDGEVVVATATVTPVAPGAGAPKGTVSFSDNGAPVATCQSVPLAIVSGAIEADCSLSYEASGNHAITAGYGGDAFFQSSTSGPATLSVGLASSTTTVTGQTTSSVTGQPVTFTATVAPVAPATGTPTGTVTFTVDGAADPDCPPQPATPATDPSDGAEATCTLGFATTGSQTVSASYSGDSDFGPSASTAGATDQVSAASTSTDVLYSGSSPYVGQRLTLLATVVASAPGGGIPAGSVTFTAGSATLCSSATISNGRATCTTSFPTAGTRTVDASYDGSDDYLASTSNTPATIDVDPAPTLTSVSGPASALSGQSVVFTADVAPVPPASGTPSGSVAFSIDGTLDSGCSAQPLDAGQANCSISFAGAGSHTVTAAYAGAADFSRSGTPAGAGASITVALGATATTLAVSPGSVVVGQPLTLTASVSASAPAVGTPTGSVAFADNGNPIGSCQTQALTSGKATCQLSFSATGSHSFTATYSGDANFSGSGSASVPATVGAASSATALSVTPSQPVFGQPLTLQATVTVVAPGSTQTTGTVTFFDGTTVLGTAAVGSGSATLTFTPAVAGSHSFTARYSGTPALSPSTSPAVPVSIGYGSACITGTSSPSITVAKGQTLCAGPGTTLKGSVTVQAGGYLALNGAVALGAIKATSPAAVTICGSTLQTAVTINGATGFVLIGDGASDCAADSISGTLSLTSNTGGMEVAGDTIGGTVSVTGNSGSGPLPGQLFPVLRSDSIGGSLSCTSNTPTLDDAGDKVTGSRSGQCALTGTTVTMSVLPAAGTSSVNQAVTYTATVTGQGGTNAPTGSVTFHDGGAPIAGCTAVAVVAGPTGSPTAVATCTVTYAGFGYHSVTASYPGSTALDGSVSLVPVVDTVSS